MALKSLTLLLAATGAGIALYRLGRNSVLQASLPDAPMPDATPMEDDDSRRASFDAGSAVTASTANPNLGERLGDMQLANAGMGTAANTDNEDLLTPPRGDEQQSEAIKPGLPDFARGA